MGYDSIPVKLGIFYIKKMDKHIKTEDPKFKNRPGMLRFLIDKYDYDMMMAGNDGEKPDSEKDDGKRMGK